jgi:dihydroorotase
MNSCFLGVQAQAYKEKIKQAAGEKNFSPLMTLYLTDNTAPEEIYRAKEEGVVALKMYPAGATTNSDSGVTDWTKCKDTLRAMQEVRGISFRLCK